MKNVKYLILFVLSFLATQSYAQGYKITLTNGKTVTVRADETEVITFTTDKDIKTDFEGTITDNAPSAAKAVDLGLSVKWANMNVGATEVAGTKTNPNTGKLDCYGDYFAWGETEGKNTYSTDTYKYYKSTTTTTTDADGFQVTTTVNGYTKYVRKSQSSSGYDGFYDDKTELEKSDDAAYANWGGTWRMPTKAEQDELLTKCTWTWCTLNGVNGYKVVGPNGNYIFLPASGYRYDSSFYLVGSSGYYWSSSLYTSDLINAYYLYFYSSNVYSSNGYRSNGRSVRAVCP